MKNYWNLFQAYLCFICRCQGVFIIWIAIRCLMIYRYVPSANSFDYLSVLLHSLKYDIGLLLLIGWIATALMIIHKRLAHIVMSFVGGLTVMAFVVDYFLLEHWQSTFNVRAAVYLMQPSYVWYNSPPTAILYCIIAGVLTAICLYYSIRRSIGAMVIQTRLLVLILLLSAPIIFLVMRGGIRIIPLNHSDAFHSHNRLLNLITINSVWNIATVIHDYRLFITKNPYTRLPNDIAQRVIDSMHSDIEPMPFPIVDTHLAPNIVMILLEGVSRNAFDDSSLGAMPLTNKWAQNALNFKSFFSAGFRTEHGLSALHSGVWSTPHHALSDQISRIHELPSVIRPLIERGYHTSFWFGGHIQFMNTKAYLKHLGFHRVYSIDYFDSKYHTQRLGVDDSTLFESVYASISADFQGRSSPQMVEILTQSTHVPYDYPGYYSSDKDQMYRNAVSYTDRQLSRFLHRLDSLSSPRPTLIIVTSDHGSQYPSHLKIDHPAHYHIPLIVGGSALLPQFRGSVDTLLMRQTNFPLTFLSWLNITHTVRFPLTYSHYSRQHRYTLSVYVDGYLYITPHDTLSYEYIWGSIPSTDTPRHLLPLSIVQQTADRLRAIPR